MTKHILPNGKAIHDINPNDLLPGDELVVNSTLTLRILVCEKCSDHFFYEMTEERPLCVDCDLREATDRFLRSLLGGDALRAKAKEEGVFQRIEYWYGPIFNDEENIEGEK